MTIESLPFPPSIEADVLATPPDIIPRIAKLHVDYLNNRISHIERLTDYLKAVDSSDRRKSFYIGKVKTALYDEDLDLREYAGWYKTEYFDVRRKVDGLCDRILFDEKLFRSEVNILDYWEEFSYWNEIDNFHGMFLTSGRWDINFMMPVLRKIIEIIAREKCKFDAENREYAEITEYLITPQFAKRNSFDADLITQISYHLTAILTEYDKKFLFLAHTREAAAANSFSTVESFAEDVVKRPSAWRSLFAKGVFPPFAWQEFQKAKIASRASAGSANASEALASCLSTQNREAFKDALDLLSAFKALELNYHIYNYKGRFGLLSKYMYIKTAGFLSPSTRNVFWEHILLDAFSDAFRVLSAEFGNNSQKGP